MIGIGQVISENEVRHCGPALVSVAQENDLN